MPSFLNINGQIRQLDGASGFQNRAFCYGDGVFETIRIVGGRAVFAEKHFQRLANGLEKLKIKNSLDYRTFINEIEKCIAANEITNGGRMRVTAFREAGGYYAATSNKLCFVIEVESLSTDFYELNVQGLTIDICDEIFVFQNQFSNLKTLNALPYVMAGIYKQEQQLGEILLLNTKGNICEGSSSNVFLFAGNTLLTPSLDQACVAGIMRSEIIYMAESSGMRVVEAAVKPEELNIAEEVFFTNSIKGVQWVAAFGKKRYFNSISKKFVECLNKKVEKE